MIHRVTTVEIGSTGKMNQILILTSEKDEDLRCTMQVMHVYAQFQAKAGDRLGRSK